MDSLKLVVDNLPLSVDDGLVLRDLLDTDFRVILLALQLQLNVQAHDFGVLEVLGLLLETGVRESLLESDTVNEKRVLEATTGDLLDADQSLIEIVLIERKHCVHNHCDIISSAFESNRSHRIESSHSL